MSEQLPSSTLPSYSQTQPWYYKSDDQERHLRIAPFAKQKESSIDEYQKHGRSRGQKVVRWRPGCCKNCGSDTHSELDCPERPRKINARKAGIGIATKEVIDQPDLSYDAKRDGWAGYKPSSWWQQAGGRFAQVNAIRAQQNVQPASMVIQEEFGSRGYRDRHDVAGYLKATSETDEWQSETTLKENEEKEEDPEFLHRKQMLEQGFEATQTIKEEIPHSTLYPEDVYEGGHTSVWGSYYVDGKWGYSCCHQTVRSAPCTRQFN